MIKLLLASNYVILSYMFSLTMNLTKYVIVCLYIDMVCTGGVPVVMYQCMLLVISCTE